ncbi:MAG: Ig-like domain-containing protein [Sulfurimonadaceae bacterium]
MAIQIGYIENISGEGTVTLANGTTATPTQNTALTENDILTTGANTIVIVKLNDGSSITVGPNQSVSLDKTVHDSEEIAADETQTEVSSLKAILAENPNLSVFEETAAGEAVAVGGSSVIVDSFVHHHDNRGDAVSTTLESFSTDKAILLEEDDRFGLVADDTPVIVTLANILTNDNTPHINGTVNDPEAEIVITVGGTDYTATNNGDGTWTLPSTDPITDGETVITVVATDPAGNTTTETAIITVDTVAPTVTVDSIVTNDTTPTISGTTNDPDAEVVVTVGGSDYTATNNGDGTWTLPATNTLPEGDTPITVVATDPAGNTTSETATITVDLTDPLIAIDPLITNDTTPAITGTTDDATATIVVTIGTDTYTATNNGDGTWTLPATDPLLEGDNVITVVATDPAGNSTTETATVVIDTTAPTVTVDTTPTNDATPVIGGTISEDDAAIVVTIGGIDYDATNNGDGTWSVPVIGTLPEGDNQIIVVATDPAGNATTQTVTLTVDTVAPIVQIDDVHTNYNRPEFTGSVDDSSAVVVVSINGTDYTATNNGDGTWTLPQDSVDALTENVDTTITVTATDPVGNATVITDTFIVDTILDDADNDNGGNVVTIDSITEDTGEFSDDFITNDTSLIIRGTYDNELDNALTIKVDGVLVDAADIVITDKQWVLDLESQPFGDGAHTIEAIVTDLAGNTQSVTQTVTVDTSGTGNDGNGTGIDGADATVTLDEISDNYINLDETLSGITVTGETTLLNGGDVVVEFNGSTYTATATGGDVSGTPNTFSLTIPTADLVGVTDGTYIVTATVVADKAGNVASDTEDVTIDTSNSDNNGNGNTDSGADATITLHEISDNYINFAETSENLVITGTSSATAGSAVTIEITGEDGVAHNINEFLDPDPVIQVDASGNFSVTFVATAFGLFLDGDYTVTATVIADNAGNTVSDTKSVTLDTSFADDNGDFPQGGGNLITIDSITDDTGIDNNDFVTSDNKLIISGSFDNETSNRILSVTVDGVAYNVTTSSNTTDKSWSVDLTNETLSDGDHTIIATIADEAGNTQTATQVVTIDTTPATADAIVLDEISNNYINALEHDQALTISGSVGSASNVGDAVTIDFNGNTYNTTVAADINGDLRFSVDIPVADVQALVDGTVYTATATTTTATLTVNDTEDVTVDLALTNTGNNNGNLITIDGITDDTGISNSDFITTDTTIIISGTYDNAADVNGIANVLTITINGLLYTPVISGTDWTIDLTNTPLSDGDYALIATLSDAAGNTSTQTQTITIDTTLNPTEGDATILLDAISDNYINLDETTSSNLITISGSTTAANGSIVSIYVDGTLFSTTSAQDGLFSLDISKDTFTVFPDGTYVVTAEVIADTAGNIASDLQTVILDTSVTDLSGGNGINGADATVALDAISTNINYDNTQQGITITGTTTLVAGNEVVVELNGKSYLTTATGANSTTTPNTFSITIPAADVAALSDGASYIVSATIIVDKAGNSVTDQENVSTDFTAPTVTVDDLNTQDTTPAFTGTVDDPTAIVVVTVGGNTYTAVNNGDTTWTLADNIIDALVPGEIAITVTATDLSGNASTVTTTTGTIIIDGVPVAFDNVDTIVASDGNTTSGNMITDTYNGNTDTLGDGSTTVSSITYDGVLYNTFAADGSLTVNAKYGDITFQQDGSYTYTYAGPDSVVTGGNTIDLWNNVGLYAFQGGSSDSYLLDSKLDIASLPTHTGDVSENSLGLGVADSGFLASDSIDGSDALVLEFADNISEVALHLNDTSFFSFFSGTTVSVFDENGVLLDTISSFTFISFFGSGDQAIQIDMGGVDFKYVVIESSSDVYLDAISYTPAVTTTTDITETFTYEIIDTDGDTSTANLIIDGNNNTILYDSNALLQDGGLGTDTLILNAVDDLDFSNISNIQNMEIIDLAGGDHSITNLSAQDVIDLTDVNNELFIYGDAGDNVALEPTLIDQNSTVTNGTGKVFDVFSDATNTVTVNIEQEIIVS